MRIGPQKLVALLAVASAVPTYFAAMCDRAVLQSEGNQPRAAATLQKDASQSKASLELPLTFERHVGDLDGMKKRHVIRALVVPSRFSFFYDKGHPQGIYFEAFDEFQRFANQKLKTGSLRIDVTYIPVRPEQLRNIAETYFKDDKLDATKKTLMVFAAYNAGPNRIVRLRKKAAEEGLDPNQWFGNVELVAAKDVGQETVQYVSNIYTYYVAYKLTLEPAEFSK